LPQDIFDNLIGWKNELVAKFQFTNKDPLYHFQPISRIIE
jgi:hypothetical protein